MDFIKAKNKVGEAMNESQYQHEGPGSVQIWKVVLPTIIIIVSAYLLIEGDSYNPNITFDIGFIFILITIFVMFAIGSWIWRK